MEKEPIYITTTIPYVNADPHIGFALEAVQADVIARHARSLGHLVFFSTGSDEHGQKIWQKANESGKNVKDYVDEHAKKFDNLKVALNLSNDNFIRTTSASHIKAAQHFWELCQEKGDIEKRAYKGDYCVGCEKFVTEQDLNDRGECPDHPGGKIETIEEENYFFKLSRYQEEILAYLKSEKSIVPSWRREEAIRFVEAGLEDFSISRIKEKMPWGVDVPGDPEHVMYVWFDALPNYISTLGWFEDPNDNFKKFWEEGTTIQCAGKDQIRFQSIMWQGMLMSAGLPLTDTVLYHGFLTSGGQKMSKSLGNVISPFDLVDEYGTDAVRYFLLREVTPFEDSDITLERFKDAYNANLANGLGNLVSRVMKMSEEYEVRRESPPLNRGGLGWGSRDSISSSGGGEFQNSRKVEEYLEQYEFGKAFDVIFEIVRILDQKIQDTKPFSVWKTDQEAARKIVRELVAGLSDVAMLLSPFLPQTAEKIEECIRENKKPTNPLFLRKE
ncbi:MAG: methionine--tRNA ligase [Candidatus Vogelbacteria bacterium CG10_big_fil_rev_8_21_14_0_10_45_14]|uniref:Methionine--tRNA ligase n=1 Tax=Candidatus Vogelbacteria bacterium CG10_big_fil_rev_8_21_14_0_10_45_14 TaxID=1975042 RepID=A0A2H0RKA6_9BACT|nr:MAG: methionine--tRNA ligase [Candidatus Vogelbacteria bacterium CG10_big_fil_rev_8_21_14_0_10_45_14]